MPFFARCMLCLICVLTSTSAWRALLDDAGWKNVGTGTKTPVGGEVTESRVGLVILQKAVLVFVQCFDSQNSTESGSNAIYIASQPHICELPLVPLGTSSLLT